MDEEIPNQFEQIYSKGRLEGLEATGIYFFHGSPYAIKSFEPRQACTDINGVPTTDGDPAVFASAEIETPIFRSLFHESNFAVLEGSYEIGFSNNDDSRHYIHANENAIEVCKQKTGCVYVFRRSDFILRGNSEWIATKEVKPVAVFYSKFEDIGLPIRGLRSDIAQENHSEKITYPKMALELKAMVDIDQDMRKRQLIEENYWDDTVDAKNTKRLKEIIDEIGWPTVSKLGAAGESSAWLIVQHADHDLDFQLRCLELMKDASATEVDPTNIAYLEDRVRLKQGKGQLYGTQFIQVDGEFIPQSIEDETNLEARRMKMGLGTMQEQIDLMYGKYLTDDNKAL